MFISFKRIDQCIETVALFDGSIVREMKTWHGPESQDLRQFAPEMTSTVIEAGHQFFLIRLPADAGDKYSGIAKVRAEVYTGNGN